MTAVSSRLLNPLRRFAGFFLLRRWPWPKWRARDGGLLPIGDQSFWFHALARPEFAWWGHMVRRRAWEPTVIRELGRALRPGDVFVDLGAFVGAYTLLASRLVGPEGRVLAFEPDPATRRILELNVATNGALNVTVVPFAVGDRSGSVRFNASGDSAGRIEAGGDIEVQQVALDDYCRDHEIRPTVMKVDIEGGEAGALGASTVAHSLRELVLEVHEPQLRALGVDVDDFLAGFGSYELLEPRENRNYAVLVSSAA